MLLALVSLSFFGIEVDIRFTLILATFAAVIIGLSKGFSLNDLINSIGVVFGKAFPIILILICIGGIVGTWMFSGTVPFLVYYGMKFLHPDFIPATAFLVTALISTFTGTSWGSAATSGVAFMGIAHSMGIPLPLVAGAAISGAVFGDKISPISDTTNICALSTEISVYSHIKGMLPNVLIAGVLSTVIFVFLGVGASNNAESETSTFLMHSLERIYNFNPIVLLPAFIIFVGAYLGYNPIALMLSSCLTAMLIGIGIQGFDFQSGVQALMSGFNLHSVSNAIPDPIVATLVNRGGFEGMMSGAVLACVLAISFGAIMERIGALDLLMKYLLKPVRSRMGLVNSAFVTGGALNGLTGNAMFSIITVGQVFRTKFDERKIARTVLSRSMENSMTLLESLIPWHVTAIFMAATLGVNTLEYVPYAVFNIIGIVLFFVLAKRELRKGE